MKKINYSLIVSDFDGTLVNDDGTISKENKQAIAEYMKNGGAFAISSGRLPSGILPRAQELGLKGTLSACQGAIILDIESQKVLSEGRISYETTLKVVEQMEEMGLHIHIYDMWECYSNMDDEPLKLYESLVGCKAQRIIDRPLSQFIKETHFSTYKILAMVKPEDNARIMSELEEAHFPDCVVTRSGTYLVEVINAKYSKGTAVQFLADYNHVSLEKTIAIGDQLNDIPMISKAGLGVAVANADNMLKENADYVCKYTNEESAVANIIEKFGYYKED